MFSSNHVKHKNYNPIDLMCRILDENPGLSREELRAKLAEELEKLKQEPETD